MQQVVEALSRATDAERVEILEHVLELARSWHGGGLPLAGVRRQSTGRERFEAMVGVALGSEEKRLFLRLADALVADEGSGVVTDQGFLGTAERHEGWMRTIHDHNGARLYQFAIGCDGAGRPVYRAIPEHVVAAHEAATGRRG